ncbi:MAG: hypothetical protein E6733_09945 [Streptococcus parasanguinis]|uniref:hypothetical protein n=1 Tax=Leclercia adecarboxylata TaxID=83655 RepID=UPI000981AD3D|nr:hypothetical protein [Leclercia adecarboxylata]MDU1985417.1 hypothetical protein [Streptococcus parasanguinis]OOB84410.1 hypothetical protein BZY71_24935 [Leclercia adecarboxylata]
MFVKYLVAVVEFIKPVGSVIVAALLMFAVVLVGFCIASMINTPSEIIIIRGIVADDDAQAPSRQDVMVL